MSNDLKPQNIQCPYCGETIDILVDCSIAEQHYIEDCQVCCRPIILNVAVAGDDSIVVHTAREDD